MDREKKKVELYREISIYDLPMGTLPNYWKYAKEITGSGIQFK